MSTLEEAIRAKLDADKANATGQAPADRDAPASAHKDRMAAAMESDPAWFETLPQRQQSEIKGWAAFRARQAARKEGTQS